MPIESWKRIPGGKRIGKDKDFEIGAGERKITVSWKSIQPWPLTGYLLHQISGVGTESRRGTLEALNPLYGVVNGEKELEHGITCQTEKLFIHRPTDFIKNSGWKYGCFCFIF